MALTHAKGYEKLVSQVGKELKDWNSAQRFWHFAYGAVALVVVVGPVLVGLSTVPWPKEVTIALGAVISVVAVLERTFSPGQVWMDYESDAQSLEGLDVDIADPPDDDAQLASFEAKFKDLRDKHVEHTTWWVLRSTKPQTGNDDRSNKSQTGGGGAGG